MTKTGTQNRPYTAERLMVRATFHNSHPGACDSCMDFDWNNRADVRIFAAMSDKHIRSGGSTNLEPMP